MEEEPRTLSRVRESPEAGPRGLRSHVLRRRCPRTRLRGALPAGARIDGQGLRMGGRHPVGWGESHPGPAHGAKDALSVPRRQLVALPPQRPGAGGPDLRHAVPSRPSYERGLRPVLRPEPSPGSRGERPCARAPGLESDAPPPVQSESSALEPRRGRHCGTDDREAHEVPAGGVHPPVASQEEGGGCDQEAAATNPRVSHAKLSRAHRPIMARVRHARCHAARNCHIGTPR